MSNRSMIFTVVGLFVLACVAVVATWKWTPFALERRITAIERRLEEVTP